MKIKLSEVLTLYNATKSLIDTKELDIDSLLKFKLLGVLKQLETYVANYDSIRNDLIIKYGKENDNGEIGISPEDDTAKQKFASELQSVLNSNIDVALTKLKYTEVFNAEIPSDYLVALYPVIEGEE